MAYGLRWSIGTFRRLAPILLLGSVLLAIPAAAVPGVPPEISSILESDQDIDPGETRSYRVSVTGFDEGGTWVFSGAGLSATVDKTRTNAVQLSVVATDAAEPGVRSLTVTNPDGLSDTFSDAITVTGTTDPPAFGDVTGQVFDDDNGNGIMDASEVGLIDVSVTAMDADGTEFAIATDGDGAFMLIDLAVGDASVVFETPAGYALTTANDSQTIAITEDVTATAEVVGYMAVPTGSVTGHVFSDTNGDGVENGTETGLAGVTVSVTDSVGASTITTTDTSGDYTVSDLAGGDADLVYTTPAGYALTTANDSQTIAITDDATATAEHVGYMPTEAGDMPNFVVVVTDDQRWDTIGRCTPTIDGLDFDAGDDACMPNLQDLLMDVGTTFLLGEVTQSLCCPSRASILTGQYTTTHGVTNNTGSDLDDSSTIATWLDDVGYRTGLVGKYLNGYGTGSLENYVPPGWDFWSSFHGAGGGKGIFDDYPWIHWEEGDVEPVITHYADVDSSSGAACAVGNFYSTDFICREALEFLAADVVTPFFLYANPIAPHSPNIAADRHVGAFAGITQALYPNFDEIPAPNPPSHLQTEPLNNGSFEFMTRGFQKATESVLAVDDMIGELHAHIEADGRLGNTVWVFISDNGVASGEHRLTNKQCEYMECHRVPFVVVCPPTVCAGASPGAVDGDNYALNIDIAPTLADLAGATPNLDVEGQSLVPILQDPSAPWRTEWFLHETTPDLDGIVGLASDGNTYKYVELTTAGETEMYDLDSDPWELVNLAGDPAYAAIESDLVDRLDAHLNG